MDDANELELLVAVAEGVLSPEEASSLAHVTRVEKRSPLGLLAAQGRLSAAAVESLRAQARARQVLGDESTATGVSLPDLAASAEPAFPVPAWDRYSNIRFLGRGGMGQVYLALDHRLRREVAIKFVRGDNPEHVRRLIAEARTQARVRHERVCKVHEVGEVEGRVYIAMEYIEGAPLGEAAPRLTLEQKAMMVRGAAEGIHEAHRVGIIHRDIKPSNILVRWSSDGQPEPCVVDFGLARALQDDGDTLSGAVIGTPRYMAPEQARGPATSLDRRADVYSLGATLYHLLAGEPPIGGSGAMEVMHNLLTVEPRPLRALDRNIPADLEAIVLKCLAKERSARYDSARALADDLGRFLDGEPVVARAAGAWYRLRTRIAKHRRLVAASAAATVLLLVAVGWGVDARRDADRRAELARRFTERVEGIEAMARYSALSPAHDVRGDLAVIRAKMAELDGEIRRAGAVALGPGYYARGRGHLALGEPAPAREQLESAWQHGFREPRVAYALALALGQLYQQELRAVGRMEQRAAREARRREIERQYRDPALGYLARSQGAGALSAGYAAALAAFYRGDLEEALRRVEVAGDELWFYEALQLGGDIHFARGQRNRGDRERARLDFEAGRAAYAAAVAVGESVPALFAALGEHEYAAMVVELYGGGDVEPAFQRVLAATTRALELRPDDDMSLVVRARARRSLAESIVNRGGRVDEILAAAMADAGLAVVLAPARPAARLELVKLYRQLGEAHQLRSEDPGEPLRRAVAIAETIPPGDGDAAYFANLGLVFKVWADYDDQIGADARDKRGRAIATYGRALQIDDQWSSVWINLAINYYMRAAAPRASDPDGDLAQALGALDRAIALDAAHVVPRFYQGQIHWLIAQRERARGGDARPSLMRARDAYRRGLVVDPRLPHLHNGLGIVLLEEAKEAWDRGADPDPLLDQARACFEQAIAVAPSHGHGQHNLGCALAQRARFQRARGEDPRESARAAVESFARALERIPNQSSFRADLGMAHVILASYDLDHRRDPRPGLAQAVAALSGALARNPREATARLHLAEVRGLEARLGARRGRGRDDDFAAAAREFEAAIELAPDDQDRRLAFGHFYCAWAGNRISVSGAAASLLERGLGLAEPLVAARPRWPDARILRARLQLLQAQTASRADDRRRLAAMATDDFAAALAINPALAPVWGATAAQARALAADSGPRAGGTAYR